MFRMTDRRIRKRITDKQTKRDHRFGSCCGPAIPLPEGGGIFCVHRGHICAIMLHEVSTAAISVYGSMAQRGRTAMKNSFNADRVFLGRTRPDHSDPEGLEPFSGLRGFFTVDCLTHVRSGKP